MKVKRYTGVSLEKIREVIVKELGNNAVIVNIKRNIDKKGLLGSKKVNYEVTVAVEEAINADDVSLGELSGNVVQDLLDIQKEHYVGIRNSIKRLDEKLADVDDRFNDFAAVGECGLDELKNVHKEWQPIIKNNLKEITKSSNPTEEDWHEALATMIPTAGGIMFRKTPTSAPDVYVLAGSTGVGKTTTLAKLAAKCVLREKLNVGLITLDTFRVAAVDQIREYASLLGIELSVAFSASELNQQLVKFADKDIVFIDTPGRSQFDDLGIQAVSDLIADVKGLCVLLVVPANIRKEDALTVFENYKVLNPSVLIISKSDEASCCDGLTQLIDVSNLPLIYITDGQRVPEDIHVASPGVVASMVMPFVKSPEPIKRGSS